jgi:hypothetical protein
LQTDRHTDRQTYVDGERERERYKEKKERKREKWMLENLPRNVGGGMLLAVRANLIFEGQKKGCSFKLQQKPKMVKQLAEGRGGGGTCVDV